ncbi:hypothetical protein ABI59_16485 [Acidobacteria bacterium Mor1]|nr:hypothetical protein ABI59_16485 [Acidobacteria bacterium Mor1]
MVLAGLAAAPGLDAAELRGDLPAVLEQANEGDWIPVTVVLERQLSREAIRDLRLAHRDKTARRLAIARRLKLEADLGQARLLRTLGALRGVEARNIQSLWISSIVSAEVKPALLQRLAGFEEIAWINHNPLRDVLHIDRDHETLNTRAEEPGVSLTDTETQCGLVLLGAPEVWNQLGITGEGAVMASSDTGVCVSHPDIVNQVWVNPGEDLDQDREVNDPDDLNGIDDDGNGLIDDLTGWNFADDIRDTDDGSLSGHGSHVVGTMAGDGTSGLRTGMAPDAKVIVLEAGELGSHEMAVWSAMQYAAEQGAGVISLSLGWNHAWDPDRASWRQNVENVIDMGSTFVVSAGNNSGGDAPSDVTTPGDVPRAITVGGTDCTDGPYGSSSQGPTTWQDVAPWNDHVYPPGLVKPDISAPGAEISSHRFCSGYSEKWGTSMAAPHVAGTAALMLSANPDLEHDQIKQILEQTSIDLGDPGKDNQYGSGRVDAFAAVSQVVGALRYEAHVVDDSNAGRGNGDGDIDYGEVVTVRVTLHNAGTATATSVLAEIATDHPGVEILDQVAFFPDIAPGASAESLGAHFTLRAGSNCGARIPLQLRIFQDGIEPVPTWFSVELGLAAEVTLFEDDMETDKGWVVSGPEATNPWVRDDPHQVTEQGIVIQPEDDTTPAPGTHAWVTGNPETGIFFRAEWGDPDDETIVSSPAFDTTGARDIWVEYQRYTYLPQFDINDLSWFSVYASHDAGQNWIQVEYVLNQTNPSWEPGLVPLPVLPGPDTRIQMRLRPDRVDVHEGAFDDVRVYGTRNTCETFVEPAAQPPNPVGATLLVDKIGSGVQLDWTAPPVDAGHDAATLYQVYRSESSQGFSLEQSTTQPSFVELENGLSGFFLVGASNGGGDSGETPGF